MTDSAHPPECADVLRLLDHGPLSAYELSALLRCSLKQTLERLHTCWWSTIPVTSDWTGFKYQRRTVLASRLPKPTEAKREWADVVTKSKFA